MFVCPTQKGPRPAAEVGVCFWYDCLLAITYHGGRSIFPPGMNYAEDRLDRKTRNHDGNLSIWNDFQEAIRSCDHSLLGRTLRDVGWNRHAIFHFAVAWSIKDSCVFSAGNYAQMVELAGFPEVGVLALLHFRSKGDLRTFETMCARRPSTQTHSLDASWLKHGGGPTGDCGCGMSECGTSSCAVPMLDLIQVYDSLALYLNSTHLSDIARPLANDILDYQQRVKRKQSIKDAVPIPACNAPALLQFWSPQHSSEYRQLTPVVQLLLIKLLFWTIPSLATDAVLYANFEESTKLASQFKSHWAYYIFIRSLVFGERVKNHRTLPYTPVWDVMWNVPDKFENDAFTFIDSLQQTISTLQTNQAEPAFLPLQFYFPAKDISCIVILGDSHVMSLAWQTISIPGLNKAHFLVPAVVTGLKAWHCRKASRFFTRSCLEYMLTKRLVCNTLILSAGEIDCREGLGGILLHGFTKSCHDHVIRTVDEYVSAVIDISSSYRVQVLVMPVAPHAHRATGRVAAQQSRRETMVQWNTALKERLPAGNVHFLDYADKLRIDQDSYVLQKKYNSDGTHLNAAFAPLFAQAIAECGCSLDLL